MLAAGCNKTEPVRDAGTNDANLEQAVKQPAKSAPQTPVPVKEKQLRPNQLKMLLSTTARKARTLRTFKVGNKVETKVLAPPGICGEYKRH